MDLKKIFNSNIQRSSFISEYNGSQDDSNNIFYERYIDQWICYGRKFRFQEDAIELSIKLHLYKTEYFSCIKAVLYSRRTDWIKLLCADWLFNFAADISTDEYSTVNIHLLKNTSDDLIKAQCILNLMLRNKANEFMKDFIAIITNNRDASVYYRAIACLGNQQLKNYKKELRGELLKNIKENSFLEQSQKTELASYL